MTKLPLLSVALSCVAVWAATAPAFAAIELDESVLDPSLQALLREDLRTVEAMDFDVTPDSEFARVFGGARGGDVTRYLEERIHYIGLDSDTDPEARKDNDANYASNFGPSFLGFVYKRDVLHQADAVADSIRFRGGPIALDSPRTGFMAVGGVYTAPETTRMDRLDTLVHEARHSDCPAMPSEADLRHYDQDEFAKISQAGQACAHIHLPCPAGHALAGELACDEHPWGAYTMGYVFSKNAYKSCRGCTEEQRQEALASATDDLTRLSRSVRRELLNGTAPAPDMSSIR